MDATLQENLIVDQQNQIELQNTDDNDVLHERRSAMNKLANDMGQVQELFQDIAVLVDSQECNIENIQSSVERSGISVEAATDQLIKAYRYRKRKRRCYKICCCIGGGVTIFSIMLWIINVKHI